jgi:hypothetical protein
MAWTGGLGGARRGGVENATMTGFNFAKWDLEMRRRQNTMNERVSTPPVCTEATFTGAAIPPDRFKITQTRSRLAIEQAVGSVSIDDEISRFDQSSRFCED